MLRGPWACVFVALGKMSQDNRSVCVSLCVLMGAQHLPLVCVRARVCAAGKESACTAGDPSSIPGSGRSPWRRDRLPTSRASLVAQMVKNLPVTWETWVQSLGSEEPLEEGMATHSSIPAWRIPMDRGAWRATIHGVTENRTPLSS